MSMPYHNKGAALFMMLASLVIMTILMGLSIQATSRSLQKRAKTRNLLKARFAAESGVAYIQSRLHTAVQMGDIRALNGLKKKMSPKTSFEVEVFLDRGFFHVISTGKFIEQTYQVEALLGDRAFDLAKFAFILEESSHELYASGSTHIEGDAALPQGNVTARQLHGEPSAKEPLISGETVPVSTVTPPKIGLFYERDIYLMLLQASQIMYGKNSLPKGDPINMNPDSRSLELKGRTLRLMAPVEIPKELQEIRGPGTILCKGDLKWDRNLKLTDNAWLIVDGDLTIQGSLEFEANIVTRGNLISMGELSGSGCLFSLTSVQLSGKSNLTSPMTMGLLHFPKLSPKTPKQIILKNMTFQGLIFAWQKPGTHWQPSIFVDQGCQMSGYLVTNGQTQIRSPVSGMVYTHELVATAGAQRFLNWMKSLEINRKPETVNWAMPPGFGQESEVLTWIKR